MEQIGTSIPDNDRRVYVVGEITVFDADHTKVLLMLSHNGRAD